MFKIKPFTVFGNTSSVSVKKLLPQVCFYPRIRKYYEISIRLFKMLLCVETISFRYSTGEDTCQNCLAGLVRCSKFDVVSTHGTNSSHVMPFANDTNSSDVRTASNDINSFSNIALAFLMSLLALL